MKDKVIWITGASSGIGAELAKQYSKKGARLILSARRKLALQAVKDSCENQKHAIEINGEETNWTGPYLIQTIK